MISREAVRFDEALQSAANEALRVRLRALWPPEGGLLDVHCILGSLDGLKAGTCSAGEEYHLLLDLDRAFACRCRTDDTATELRSFVRHVEDRYERRPLHLLQSHVRANGFKFMYPAESLDVLRMLWRVQEPGQAFVLEFGSGDIGAVDIAPHPEVAVGGRRVRSPVIDANEGSDRRGAPAGERLRLRPPVLSRHDLGDARWPGQAVQVDWSPLSMPLATTVATWDGGRQTLVCSGKGLRAEEAEGKARFEELERLHLVFNQPARRTTCASYEEVASTAVDPRSLFYDRCTSHREGPDYAPSVPMHWTEARGLGDVRVLVPAQEIWFRTHRLPGENRFVRPTTNGCAIGASFEEAALFALFEVIERDAYLATWYLRRPCAQIALESVRFEPSRMILARWGQCMPDYTVHIFDITMDTGVPTVMAVATRPDGKAGPKTIHGAGTHMAAEQAVFAALSEISAMAPGDSWNETEARHYRSHPEDIVEPRHHFLLYALDEAFERLRFLGWDGERTVRMGEVEDSAWNKPNATAASTLDEVVEHLKGLGIEVYFKEVSFPGLAERGLRCVKVVAPGLFPMWFGHGWQRYALTERLRGLGQRYCGRVFREESELNGHMHPFA